MEEQEIHLLDYIHVIANRKWILIASVFCVLTTVIVGTLLTQPLYRADAKLKIGKDKIFSPMIGRRMDYWEPEYSESISFKTHAEMINSFPVMYKAAKALKLDEIKNEDEVDPTFKEIIRTNLAKMKGWFFSLFSIFSRKEDEKTIPYPEDPYTQWAFALKGEVNVSPIRDTRIIVVSVTDSDPVFCRDAANKICESYIKYLAETRLESSKKVLSFFKEELFKMEEKIDESEKKFFNFKQKEKIFSLEGKKNISFKGIGSLNEDLIKTRVGRNDLEERVKELKRVLKKGRIGDFTSGILDNKILFDLKGDLIRTEIELEELKNVYKEKHPKIIQAKIKIRNIKESFKRELRKALDSLNQEISILKGKEDNIKTQLKDIEKKDFSLSERELRYAMLEREVETNRELYDALLTNLKETDVLKEIGEEDIRLIEAAHIPSYPIKPRKTLNIFLGLICGLSLGVGLSFFFDYMDRSIKTEEDVAKYIKAPLLSLLPKNEEIIINNEKGQLAESFRNLCTNLEMQAVDTPLKTLIVTSSEPEEGKTTVVVDLGITLARHGAKVILIDTDLKAPSLGKLWGQEGGGLTGLLKEFPQFKEKGEFNEEYNFGDIQRLIFIEGKTGILEINKDGNHFRATFDKGRLIDISWQNRPSERRLGQMLLKSSSISESVLEDALTIAKSTNKKVGDTLLSLDSVAPEKMEKLLGLHIAEAFSLIFAPGKGMYEFTQRHEIEDHLIFDSLEKKLRMQVDTPYLEKKVNTFIADTGIENLKLLSGGESVPNPFALITSRRFETILSICKNNFDYILMDSPPIFIADSIVLSRYSDGTIFVIRSDKTRPTQAKKAFEILKGSGANVLGVVLNGVDPTRGRYSYYYNYGEYYKEKVS